MRNKSKKVGLYTPYLDVMGGGELHVLLILRALEDFGFKPIIYWDKNLEEKIQKTFNLDFHNLEFRANIFSNPNRWLRLTEFASLDIFIYVSDGSYFFSPARKNFVFYMVPEKKLFQLNFLAKVKLANWRLLANSAYTAGFIKRWLGREVEVLYPYINEKFFEISFEKKEDVILNVGRFFKHLHAKRQDKIIKSYKNIKQKNPLLKKFKLILAGRLKEEDKDFFAKLKSLSEGDNSIFLYKNAPFSDILRLYEQARFYWHFTGWGQKSLERVEHLGISIIEAMAAGAVVFAYAAGGPKEIIEDGKNGFLFSSEDELERKFTRVLQDQRLENKLRYQAREFAEKNFSKGAFLKKVEQIFL